MGGASSSALPPLTLDSGTVVMRRLSRVEYNNTVRDLLQTEARPADAFPGDQVSQDGFDTVGAVLSISQLHTQGYETAAIDLVEDLFAQPSSSPARQAILVCEASLKAGLEAVLLSPYFIFRVETDANPTSPEAHPVTDFELATRLSYFLWSSRTVKRRLRAGRERFPARGSIGSAPCRASRPLSPRGR